ncbi:CDP-glycerol glycerophosphotransferase family protein [Aeromicrobium sp. CFBP 8757]|uniref:CDP-glycerol glycerophosphotransferase family protein n=1 Tax=Aeromicrobium sp. CFBP 8757 TaxID=2775288 RepID=UPI0017864E2A|nr:CDP-glycerol glycerophosphotransferase family protein [Aeromicrobium sp. CFBP 8757]MBD8605711.1 CDP-glycerol glycerophosphotransferase family protein [Aeromicrobium sp. CFBP 8757]
MPSPVNAARAAASRLGRSQELPALAATVGGLLLAVLCAVAGLEIAALLLLLVSVVGEAFFERRPAAAGILLRHASVGVPMRFALRLVVALVATEHADSVGAWRALAAVGVAEVVVLCARALHVTYREIGPLKPMRTRNVPGDTRIHDAPPARVVEVVVSQLLVLVPTLVGAPWWLVVALAAVGIAVLVAASVPDMRASWRMRQQKRATGFTGPLRQVQDFLDDYRPEVVVHLSGPDTAAYQINTWLEALESLDRRVFIVLRDPPLFGRMASTSIPALELRDPGELLMLDFRAARIALYPANTGNNIHLLRLPTLMSAFIGHGDSDKSASNNPFSRAYDELWVAGEAGADRYRRSGLGIHEGQYRYVGRPQVHAISREPALGAEDVPTVLYAPTWEGVNLDQEYSSVSAVGVRVVEALLAAQPPVRVVFKAHPFTGQRDAKYRFVLARIAGLIDDAAARTGIDHRVVKGGSINEWFNRATALVTDISSVVSDFLASEKPYAVFNHTDLDDAAFREEFPSTGAGTTIGRDGRGIAEFIDVVTRVSPDLHAERRASLAAYLLGPPEHRSLESFQAAIDAMIARSEADRAAYRDGTPTSEIPPTDASDLL